MNIQVSRYGVRDVDVPSPNYLCLTKTNNNTLCKQTAQFAFVAEFIALIATYRSRVVILVGKIIKTRSGRQARHRLQTPLQLTVKRHKFLSLYFSNRTLAYYIVILRNYNNIIVKYYAIIVIMPFIIIHY